MNKRLLSVFIATMILTLGACGSQAQPVEISTTATTETTTTTSAATTTTAAKTTKAATTTTAKTTVATTTAKTTTITTTTEPIVKVDLADFKLNEYCGEFDEAEPMYYVSVSGDEFEDDTDENRLNAAIEAVKASDYYSELIEEAKSLFTYENGTFVPTGEGWTYDGYKDGCLTYDETEGYVVTPTVTQNHYLNFNLQDKETLLFLEYPLIGSQFEWSGTSVFYIPVFINADNQAFILHESVSQSLYASTFLKFEDGYHVFLEGGHTTGTSFARVYSFLDGTPKLEYKGRFLRNEAEGYLFVDDKSGGLDDARVGFFRDKTRDCYCGLSAKRLNPGITEALLEANPDVTSATDFFSAGGKYIFSLMGSCYTLENTTLVETDFDINCPANKDEFDIVLNIDLSKHE